MNPLQLELLEKNILEITGGIEANEKMFFYVEEAILRLTAKGSPEIEIYIRSPGGSVFTALNIYDILRYYKGKKTGIVVGYAASMAAIILQACDVRKAYRYSEILIHHIATDNVSLDIMRSKEGMARLKLRLEKSQEGQYLILSQRTGKTISEIRKECAKNKGMDPERAK